MKIYEAKITYTEVREAPAELFTEAEDIVKFMDGAFDEDPLVESLYLITTNNKNRLIARKMITKGLGDRSLVGVKEIFRPAILCGANGIVMVHNHPSGDPTPSRADIQVTKKIQEACEVMEFRFLDHIIIGDSKTDPNQLGYFSFLESSML